MYRIWKGTNCYEEVHEQKWLLIAAAIIIVAVFSAVSILSGGIPVETAAAEKGEVVRIISESGTVESESSIVITAKTSNEINSIMVSEGDRIKAGDLLVSGGGSSAELDIKSLQSELAGLRTQYNLAKDLADNNKKLYEQGALSFAEYNQSEAAAKQLEAQINSLKYSIDSYEESTGAAGITVPIDGVITGVFIKEGETVVAGSPLFEISNLDDTYVKVNLIAEDADYVRKGDQVMIYNNDAGFSDENCKVRKVHLKAHEVMSELGINQKRVTVEVDFGGEAGLRLGSDVDVEIIVEKKENIIRISNTALFEIDQNDYVFVAEGGKAVLRRVETGVEGEDYTEIVSGLSDGEEVILSPGDDIEDGARIKKEEGKQ